MGDVLEAGACDAITLQEVIELMRREVRDGDAMRLRMTIA
jgi:hypothetical protein